MMNYIEQPVAEIKMLPVCSCGHVFWGGIHIWQEICDIEVTSEVKLIKYSKYCFNPSVCPKCGKRIECVMYNDHACEIFTKGE